eukprot:TRINITY_DN55214_c0_g1_i1.p1 TRINITY_DN55214_c0_g1~~TRINITY_DN55214_c0_g1_i1.p1  ORF type:complete len:743 (+),score=357.81 TRINITY_DN55214_c0_g1_i1:87-2315(+)
MASKRAQKREEKTREEQLQAYVDLKYEEDLGTAVIIDNIPKVDPAKAQKLLVVLNKKIKENVKTEPRFVELVRDEAGCTLGYCLVEFETPEQAKQAVAALHNHRLDKTHTFKCNVFSERERLEQLPSEYVEPKTAPDFKFVEENLYEYVCDKPADESQVSLAREQYLIRNSSGTEKTADMELAIYWNDYQIDKDSELKDVMLLEKKKSNWTGPWVQWSPHGTFLVTFDEKGIYLWGGKEWREMGRFLHNDVQAIEFSQHEKYLMTWCRRNELHIWDVSQGRKLRRFQALITEDVNMPLKLFKWSPDERFLMRLSSDNILIHDLQNGLRLVMPDPEKSTSIHVEGLKCETWDRLAQKPVPPPVEWSPTDNLIAYWVPERGHAPAKVALVEVVITPRGEGKPDDITFETRAERNIFGVHRVRMTWHPQGDFLACKVEREKKGAQGKIIVSTYEMFRVRGGKKEWPVETLEVADPVIAFDWEPRGHRFALVHGPRPSDHAVSFYTMGGRAKGELRLIKKLTKREVNGVYWSPRGHHAVLAGTDQPFHGKVIEFWDVDALERNAQAAKPEPLASREHHMLTSVLWDASGRYVTTFVEKYHVQSMANEHGFRIYTFQGRLVVEKKIKHLWQFLWRPRPPSLLGDKEIKQLQKTRRTWEEKYRELDYKERTRTQREEQEKKRSMTQEFMKRKAQILREQGPDCKKIREQLWEKSGATHHIEGVGFTWKVEKVDELVDKREERVREDRQ